MKEEQDRILDLKEEGYSWVQIANRLGYPSMDSVRGKVRHTERYKEMVVAHFGKEWGESKSRYLITGHFHHEKSLSFAGLTWYQLQSPSKHSSYDKTYGYDTSESGQMLFEFSETKRSAIYYM